MFLKIRNRSSVSSFSLKSGKLTYHCRHVDKGLFLVGSQSSRSYEKVPLSEA